MTAGQPQTFEQFVASLGPLSSPESIVPPEREIVIRTAVEALQELASVDRAQLANLVRSHPEWVPVLGLLIGLSQEQLKNHLRFTMKSSAWLTLARRNPDRLIEVLDTTDLRLVELVEAQRKGSYTLADVLIARAGARERAGRAVSRGRKLENLVEEIIKLLKLKYDTRTRFIGSRGEDAPCDFAIPGGKDQARIVIAVKGFDSTGSKLSAAVDEIDLMGRKRRPDQYVYAIVDGIGWLNRQADLRRIFEHLQDRRIDGLYTLASLPEFESDLANAAKRLEML